ncbi:NAD-dependent epimerase/dehydratase family protein [Mesorhizobium sp. SARCC-RB16n]|uniref:NAD-dependent epimerase/dehydratase family protein n=1 Tax=Mesorhizobium sp. SARCC-RB16n TaxID=2116687 RepID=UPI00122F60FA|nr:NAD-dependent epimerase/dehydratase family protein [Mesorhizobium sp. SARCC-RB16n]
MARSAIIVGGTGQIGQAAAMTLLRDGWNVSIMHRGNRLLSQRLIERGAHEIIHDRGRGLAPVIGRGADLLIDAIAFDAVHADQLLQVQDDVGAFVVISSSSVYCDDLGRTLDDAIGSDCFPDFPKAVTELQKTVSPGSQNYSAKKIALEQRLLNHATTPVTILRPCAIHGVNSSHAREWWFVKRMLDERPAIPLAYRGESRFHTTSVANIAGLIGILAGMPGTRVLNIGDEHCLTVAEIGSTIARHLGFEGRFVLIEDEPGVYPAKIGSTPWSIPKPFMIDSSAARALGFAPLPYAATIGAVCDWLSQLHSAGNWLAELPVFGDYSFDPFDYVSEDRWLAQYPPAASGRAAI